jgi:hypothetical protein
LQTRFFGRDYLPLGTWRDDLPTLALDPARAGRLVGTVAWDLLDSDTNPCYRLVDGASGMLAPGTPVFAVQGYREDFRLIAETPFGWRVLEAYPGDAAGSVGDLLDIRARVASVRAEREDFEGARTPLAALDGAAPVSRLVDLLLAEPVAPSPGEDRPSSIRLTFTLADGTVTMRRLYAGQPGLEWGIPVSHAFMARLEAALEAE